MNERIDEPLFFDAVLYVLDEMSPSDRVAFEQRLTEEQGAREALAGAVQFCQTLTQGRRVGPQSVGLQSIDLQSIDLAAIHHQKSRRGSLAIWGAAVAMAAGVLAMALIGPDRKDKPPIAVVEMDRAKQLAVAWANLPSHAEAMDDGGGAVDIAADPLPDEWLDDAHVESDANTEREAAPTDDWLLEALIAA